MPEVQKKFLHIKFDGTSLAEGSIDVFDLANTILAFGQTIERIAENEGVTRDNQIRIEVNTLRPGSFDVGMLVSLQQHAGDLAMAAGPLLLMLGAMENKAEFLVNVLKKVIAIKKFLQGRPPKEVVINQNGNGNSVQIFNFNGEATTVSMPVYNALQDKKISEGVKKITEPLKKEGGNIEQIYIEDDEAGGGEQVLVTKEEIDYFERTDELQKVPGYRVKGVVTMFDRKTFNGRLTLNASKRVIFEIGEQIATIEQVNQVVERIIESLSLKIGVILEGDAVLDFESNLKKIIVTSVSTEARLI